VIILDPSSLWSEVRAFSRALALGDEFDWGSEGEELIASPEA